jgi:hypothetical protein
VSDVMLARKMKARIALFGLPSNSNGKLRISIYANETPDSFGANVYDCCNNESGEIIDYLPHDIKIGSYITIQITSFGITEYLHSLRFEGADISHVPFFKKELNTNEQLVSRGWNLDFWRQWNPKKQHDEGVSVEKKYITERSISVEPLWKSYYDDSNIDYLEKFHKLWIGLNAYATYKSTERGDKRKVLSLVESGLKDSFYRHLRQPRVEELAKKWRRLQQSTGQNMTSNIVREEIGHTCHSFDFLEKAKSAAGLFDDAQKLLEGLVFLDSVPGGEVFQHVYISYYRYMDTEQGRVSPFNLAYAFSSPYAPSSVKRYGRLIFHHPYELSEPGSLFSLEDYFGSEYANAPYQGQIDLKLKQYEEFDPLFFRYLYVLYLFRCAYFHGDLLPIKQNNELAKAAYLSLHELFPATFE